MPRTFDTISTVGRNGSVQMTAVGTPFFSSSIPSCTLHEEQEPQSPTAVMARSHFSAISA